MRLRPDGPYQAANVAYLAARVAARMGDHARAMELLREVRRRGGGNLWELHLERDLASLRGTPAFEEFMRPRR